MSIIPGSVAVGELVEVYMFQRWRSAEVLRVTPKRVLVGYWTPRGVKARRELWLRHESPQIRRAP